MLTPAMAQEVWKSPERPSIEKRPGRCANTVSIPGLTTKQEWLVSKHTHAQPRGVATDRPTFPMDVTTNTCAYDECSLPAWEELSMHLCQRHAFAAYAQVAKVGKIETALAMSGLPNTPRSEQPSLNTLGYVYFAKRDRLVKIGYSTDVHKRMQSLRADLLVAIPGTMVDERAHHKRFAYCHDHGEWFKPSKELVSYIKDLREHGGVCAFVYKTPWRPR